MNRREFLNRVGRGAVVAGASAIVTWKFGSISEAHALREGSGTLRVVDKGVVYDKSPAIIAGNCRCKNGDLVVAYNTGGDLSAGQRIGFVRSTDGGKTWGGSETFFDSVFKKGGVEAGCSLTCLSNGRLLLPYADGIYLYPQKKNNYDRLALLFCPTSDDNGKTWQNTKAQTYDGLEGFAFGKVLELPNGKLLLPLWGSREKHGTYSAGVVQSKDGGNTWGDWRCIGCDHGDETPIILLPDGRVLALIRGYSNDPDRPFHVAHSKDNGETWTAPQKVNMNGTAPALHLTPKGRLLAGYRSTVGTPTEGRCHVSSSKDNGLTWTFELELELPRGTWSYGGYPAFTNLPDGRIFVTFHNGPPKVPWYTAYNILVEE